MKQVMVFGSHLASDRKKFYHSKWQYACYAAKVASGKDSSKLGILVEDRRERFSASLAPRPRKGLYFEMHHLEVMELFSLISDKFT